jgi:hypothetical protein
MNRGGFSWKRFVGISAAKARLSRKIGIPLTHSGRNQKIGRMVTRGGCLVMLLIPVIIIIDAARLFFFEQTRW